MHSIKSSKKRQGFSLTEVLVSVTIFSVMSIVIFGNVFFQGKSFAFNRASNVNSGEASYVVNRLVYGNDSFWGLRVASQKVSRVASTGVTGPSGQVGWQATLEHILDTTDLPAVYADSVQVVTYSPTARTIALDGIVVGTDIEDSYFRIESGDIFMGVQVENLRGGIDTVLETRIRMRNN